MGRCTINCEILKIFYCEEVPKPYVPNDAWSKRAAKEGYRARSVFKLQELDEKFHLIRQGMSVLDLGAAPGSWLQYVSKAIGPTGHALGLDLKEIEEIDGNVKTTMCDITDQKAVSSALEAAGMSHVDLVLSDLAPNTSGIKDVDQWKSIELSQAVSETAKKFLKKGGMLVIKIFRGKDFDAFLSEFKRDFANVKIVTVKASRDRSREVYLIGRR